MILITNVNYIKQPFISTTTYILGLFGDWSHTFEAFEEKGIFFINNKDTVMSLYLDLECSGIIEMLVFVSLVLFFPVFNKKQRILNAIKGCCFLYIFNFIRILLILIVLYFFGTAFYPLVHSFVGRIVFYILTIVLYFNVFTRSQIKKQKVGNFNYDN